MRTAAPALIAAALVLLAGCADAPVADPAPAAQPAASAARPSPAAAAPTTRAYTPAPAPTTTVAPVAPVQEFSGDRDDVVTLSPTLEFGILTFSCDSCDRNVLVKSIGSGEDLFVNSIGTHSGTYLVSQPIDTIQVEADGDWTMQVGPLDLATRVSPGQPASGTGDTVLFWSSLPNVVEMSHDGERNFVVNVTGANESDLVVNEIGAYSGTQAWPGGQPGAVEVTADGAWTLTPRS